MSEISSETLVQELLATVDEVGQVESWVNGRCDGSIPGETLAQACALATEQLLRASPPQTGTWEHILVTLAAHSQASLTDQGINQCRAMVDRAGELLQTGTLAQAEPARIRTMATALTVVLAAQKKLRQVIEQTVRTLCEQFPEHMPQIAGQCQDIWKRQGQMSGEQGLFLWDTRREEWRLAQDFKSYRPE